MTSRIYPIFNNPANGDVLIIPDLCIDLVHENNNVIAGFMYNTAYTVAFLCGYTLTGKTMKITPEDQINMIIDNIVLNGSIRQIAIVDGPKIAELYDTIDAKEDVVNDSDQDYDQDDDDILETPPSADPEDHVVIN